MRHPVTLAGHPPEARSGTSRARHDSDDPGHLLTLPAQHGRSDREGDGGGALIGQETRCCTVAAPRPWSVSGASFLLCVFPANRNVFLVGLPGLEPGTSSLSEKRSNRLSYRP